MMLHPIATSEAQLGVLALGLVIAGTAGGLIAGMLGVGGGIVIVPILYHVLAGLGFDDQLRMHLAAGTSLATIIPTSISSLRAHARRGNVDWALLRKWVLPMIGGVALGTAVSGTVSGSTLSLIFACVALPIAANMAFGKDNWRLASELPRGFGGSAIAVGIGWLSSMMGLGGGTLGVPIMSHCNYPIHRAVGTASAFGVIISIPATVGMALAGWNAPGLPIASLGYVSLLGFILIAPASVLMAPVGAHLAHNMDRKLLRALFALFIAVTATRMLWSALS